VKALLADRAPVLSEPEVPFVPDQPPEAVHEVALVEVQVRVEELPDVILDGLADSNIVGAAVGTDGDPAGISSILSATIT
jgi:hypothetical protein